MKPETRQKIVSLIAQKGRLLTDEEAFDFYTENIMRNDAACKFNPWKNKGQGKYEDYGLQDLQQKARQWHRMTIGALALRGLLKMAPEK